MFALFFITFVLFLIGGIAAFFWCGIKWLIGEIKPFLDGEEKP
jgi:hypothetical protein